MRKIGLLLVLSLLLVACGDYTETGTSTTSRRGMQGGEETVKIAKANGTSGKSLEVEDDSLLEVDVTLSAGKGSYKIELLGQDDKVTLTLEARDGKTVSGHGQMASDSFGDASYRVTAVDAENVAYTLKYTYR